MAQDKVKFKSGAASATLDQSGLIDSIDAVTEGSATQFIEGSEKVIGRIQTAAEARWPVLTGKSKAGMYMRTRVASSAIRVAMFNRTPYIYYVRFSKRTRAELDREAAQVGEAVGSHSKPPAGLEGEAQAAAMILSKRFGRRPTQREATAFHLRQLPRVVPTDPAMLGKQAWSVLAAKPHKAATPQLVKDLQGALDKLAGGQ